MTDRQDRLGTKRKENSSKNAGVASRLISSRLASPRSHTRVCVRSDWDILTSTTEWITETSKNKDVPWFAFQVRKQAF
jgi:hypothetical protein